MGEELVEGSSPKLTDSFCSAFAYHLSIGMTDTQYWHGDVWLAYYYRESYKLKHERANSDAWLNGLYVYHAVSVSVYNALRKKGAKAEKYPAKPFELGGKKPLTEKEIEAERKKTIAFFTRMEKNWNMQNELEGEHSDVR